MALTAAMWRRIGAVTGWVVRSTAAVTGAAVVGTAAYFGRRVLTPDAVHPDDCELVASLPLQLAQRHRANGSARPPAS